MPTHSLLDDIMAVQPMNVPHKKYFIEVYDLSNPRVGQVFSTQDKHSKCGGCCRTFWHKIWTPTGWVFEETNPEEYKKAVETYVPSYKNAVAKEREMWNKEHDITEEDYHFPMSLVIDSKRQK